MKPSSRYLLILALVAGATGLCHGAELSLAPSAAQNDDDAVLLLRLTSGPGEEVAGLQCDIDLRDAGLLYESVEVGPEARVADKTVSVNQIGPSQLRLILIGLNQNVIADGVVAEIRLARTGARMGAPDMAKLSGIILSDPFGTRIPATSSSQGATQPSEASSSKTATSLWAALILIVVVLALVVAATRQAQRNRRPGHARRLRTKTRRESKSC